MLELKKVSKIYKTKSQDVRALDRINLVFPETGLVFITGKSGSGKTTLLNVIGGLDNFEEGEIVIKNKSTKDFTRADFDSYRNTYIGFVFQEYNLLDTMTIEKNLALASELQGKKADKEKIEEILKTVDLEEISNRKPQELSGGQRQRVAIARALIKNPSIIMADEPTGALDTANGLQVMTLLKKLSKEKLVIIVSHDLELANKFADRIINLEDGHIESDITISVDESIKDNLVSRREGVSIKRNAELNQKELETIRKAVASGKNVQVTDNINVTRKKTGTVETKKYNDTSFIKTHMGFWDTLKLGVTALKTKKVRLTITIILCAIAFAIFGIFDSLAIYEESRLTANTLRASLSPSTTITTNIKEDNGNSYAIQSNDALVTALSARTGYAIKGAYNGYYVGSNTIPREMTNNNPYRTSRYYYYKKLLGTVEFDQEELEHYKFSVIAGRLPEDFDEVAISEYYANCMINWWYSFYNSKNDLITPATFEELKQIIETEPPTITIGTTSTKKTYKIVGIVSTGKINKRFDKLVASEAFEKSSSMEQNEFLNYINNSYNLYLFTKPGFTQNAMATYNTLSKYINSAYSYQFDAESNDTISVTNTTFYNFDELQAQEENYFFLDSTQTSLEDNEIMVDISQFQTLYSDYIVNLIAYGKNSKNEVRQQTTLETEQLILELKNGTTAERITNLKKIITNLEALQKSIDGITRKGKNSIFARTFVSKKFDTSRNPIKEVGNSTKFKVVGFYTGLSGVNSFVFESNGLSELGINLSQGNYNCLIATDLGKANIGKLTSLLLSKSGLYLGTNNSTLATVRANTDFFSKLSILFLIVSAVFAVFSVVMFSNFISTSIKSKYNEIGILRALGARGLDILKMFLVESLALALINAVFASIITTVGCIFVNMFLSNILNIAIPLASFGIRQIGIILGLSVAVGAISAIIPIWSVSKQKPVETIRKAF